MHEHERGPGDRPRLGAGFVSQDHAEAGACFPIRVAGRGRERCDAGRNGLAGPIYEPGRGEAVLRGIGVFDISDRSLGACDGGGMPSLPAAPSPTGQSMEVIDPTRVFQIVLTLER